MPRRLGQHFLGDANWRARILRELRPKSDDVWLEIGAGHGEFTRELARQSKRVKSIELDAPLLAELRALAAEFKNIEVVEGDVLALDLHKLIESTAMRVYGSLPYYITSPILRRLFEHADSIADIHVVIQMEVAERIVAQPGRRDYGFLSVLAQFYAEPKIALRIPPGAFRPPPKVDSALVRLELRAGRGPISRAKEAAFLDFVGRCFEQKRKTLLNNLKASLGAGRATAAIASAGLRPDARAEQLFLPQFVRLFESAAERG